MTSSQSQARSRNQVQSQAIWLTDPGAYIDKMRKLVADRDPLVILAETPAKVAGLIADFGADQLRARPYPGKWTPTEIIGHFCDVEWAYAWRLRLILCQDGPTITGYDQDSWVAGQRYNDQDPWSLVDQFRHLREYNLTLWRRLGPEDLKRHGEHVERGRETLGTMLVMLAGHDLWHLDQLKRYVAAVSMS